jgi:hypothetical protein
MYNIVFSQMHHFGIQERKWDMRLWILPPKGAVLEEGRRSVLQLWGKTARSQECQRKPGYHQFNGKIFKIYHARQYILAIFSRLGLML